jgi:hypothetical protein
MAPTRVSRKQFLRAAGGLASAFLAGCGLLERCGRSAVRNQAARSPVTLVIWENSLFKWREDIGKQITDPLLAANPWLTLDSAVPTRDGREKLLAVSASGSAPDIYPSGSHWVQQDLGEGARRRRRSRRRCGGALAVIEFLPDRQRLRGHRLSQARWRGASQPK